LDLIAGPVDQDHFHAQGTKHGEVEEDVRKVLGAHHLAIHGNHKNTLPEERHILQNFTQVGNVHW
jgi:hypothetical protein